MKRILGLLTLALIFTSCSHFGARTYSVSDEAKLVEYQLDNGLTVILIPNKKAPVTEVKHWVKVGSLHETEGITGISHLFEHMMFRPVREGEKGFFEKVNKLGGSPNANTRFASTPYSTTIPTVHLEELLKIEADRFKNLKVTEKLLKIEREAVRSEYATKMDSNPTIDLWESFYRKGFKDHPYGWMIIGERADLDKITAKDCNEFFHKYYRPNNVALVISGDIDTSDVKGWVEKYYGDWEKGQYSALPPKFENEGKMIKAKGKLSSPSRFVLAGYRIPEPDLTNYELQELAHHIFIGSDFSLGDREILMKSKMVSFFQSFNFDYDRGSLKFFVDLNKGQTLKSYLKKVDSLKDKLRAMSEEEFETYKDHYMTSMAERIQRNSNLAEQVAFGWGKYGDSQAMISKAKEKLNVTKEELVAFADKYFVEENMIVVTNKNFKD